MSLKSDYLIDTGLYISQLDNFTLEEACVLQQEMCHTIHTPSCTDCTNLINISKAIADKGMLPLSSVFKQFCKTKKYVSTKAVRFLMGMPLVAMQIGNPGSHRLYVMPKEKNVNYNRMHKNMQQIKLKDSPLKQGLTKDFQN